MKTGVAMLENRKIVKRWDLLLFLPVHLAESGEVFGHIADMTTEGIMVFSKDPYPLNQTYSLELCYEDLENALLNKGVPPQSLRFDAQTRWSDTRGTLCRTGLMFIDTDQEIQKTIRSIVRNVARNFN